MDTIELIREFAKLHNIDDNEADAFLKLYQSPTTLYELWKLPYDLQRHESSHSVIPEPLRSFIVTDLYDAADEDQLITLNDVYEKLEEKAEALLGKEFVMIDDVGFEQLTTENLLAQLPLEELKSIAKCVVDFKFGSVDMYR